MTLKYVIMIYSNPATWVHPMFLHQHAQLTPAERAAQLDEFRVLMTEIAQSGELIDTAALGDPVKSRTIRFRDGAPAVTDGPFADAKEQMAGYFVVDCATPERAAEIAARFPDARYGGVEIRPVVDRSEMEM
ncbi:YciI family protein [Dactylosporangium sp. NPDC051484]|uniref:YciI family protein n=1 Tax=Dactylosporangium sp. NPDC051484 TaxID=3154942 RepID=UPI003450D4AE